MLWLSYKLAMPASIAENENSHVRTSAEDE
jgi:hypothetical protein